MGQVMWGSFSERHREWLADVDAARQLPEAPSAARSWLLDQRGPGGPDRALSGPEGRGCKGGPPIIR
jgi:hypothetical protein